MIDPFEWVNSQDWGIDALKAALANESSGFRLNWKMRKQWCGL